MTKDKHRALHNVRSADFPWCKLDEMTALVKLAYSEGVENGQAQAAGIRMHWKDTDTAKRLEAAK